MQNEDRLAEEEYYVRWLGERVVGERSGVRLAERGGGMNTGCDVWWNNAIMLNDKRWYRYQTRILIEMSGCVARVTAEEWGCVVVRERKGKIWILGACNMSGSRGEVEKATWPLCARSREGHVTPVSEK
jgi:hypothetical protein